MNDVEGLKIQLESIAESLNDLAMSLLSEAIESGSNSRPHAEKCVSQARRAVEKAIHHLQNANGD